MSERKTMFTESALIERDIQTARGAIADFKNMLTEQGIPIDKLLNGEMVAVSIEPKVKVLPWHIGEFTDQTSSDLLKAKIAQLDDAGGQIVTPEDVECGACERKIPVDAAACPYCHTIFPEKRP